jgi:hypothetical protein
MAVQYLWVIQAGLAPAGMYKSSIRFWVHTVCQANPYRLTSKEDFGQHGDALPEFDPTNERSANNKAGTFATTQSYHGVLLLALDERCGERPHGDMR